MVLGVEGEEGESVKLWLFGDWGFIRFACDLESNRSGIGLLIIRVGDIGSLGQWSRGRLVKGYQ